MTTEQFWARTVLAGPFFTAKESWVSLHDRLREYPQLLDLMPVNLPGQRVLDFGCGPGHDTLLFAVHGADVHYYDMSPKAMTITTDRLRLHHLVAHPAVDGTYDHIHCAGVLHHTERPDRILEEFSYVLRPNGEIRLMVYDGALSTHSQSEVPITEWWDEADITRMAAKAGFEATHVGSYPCSSEWRPDCYAACYTLRHT